MLSSIQNKQNKKIVIGQCINHWTVVQLLGVVGRTRKYIIRCNCGKLRTKSSAQIFKTMCCDECSQKIQTLLGGPRRTHGCCAINSPNYKTYMAWHYMHRRCEGKTIKEKKNYVDRGINVCDRWHRDTGSFDNFLLDMGMKPENTSLDRIDNNKGYSPDNCRWASVKNQNDNKRGCIFYSHNGENLTIARWAERWGITRSKAAEWLKREGIKWVIENLDKIKTCKVGMSNNDYVKLGLSERKGSGQRKHQASRPFHTLHAAYKSWDYMKHTPQGMCSRWMKDFMNFIEDMGSKPVNLKLRRKFVNQQFSKKNCYWG